MGRCRNLLMYNTLIFSVTSRKKLSCPQRTRFPPHIAEPMGWGSFSASLVNQFRFDGRFLLVVTVGFAGASSSVSLVGTPMASCFRVTVGFPADSFFGLRRMVSGFFLSKKRRRVSGRILLLGNRRNSPGGFVLVNLRILSGIFSSWRSSVGSYILYHMM